MKVVKVFTVNTGGDYKKEIFDGRWMFAQSHTAVNEVIKGFLKEGWSLVTIQPEYNPNILNPGSYTFYRGGVMLVFEKDIDEGEDDGAEELMQALLESLQSVDEEDPGKTLEYDADDFDWDDLVLEDEEYD